MIRCRLNGPTQELRDRILRSMCVRRIAPGHHIIQEDCPQITCFVVKNGIFEVYRKNKLVDYALVGFSMGACTLSHECNAIVWKLIQNEWNIAYQLISQNQFYINTKSYVNFVFCIAMVVGSCLGVTFWQITLLFFLQIHRFGFWFEPAPWTIRASDDQCEVWELDSPTYRSLVTTKSTKTISHSKSVSKWIVPIHRCVPPRPFWLNVRIGWCHFGSM